MGRVIRHQLIKIEMPRPEQKCVDDDDDNLHKNKLFLAASHSFSALFAVAVKSNM